MTKTTKHIALICPGGPISRELAENVRAIAEPYGDQCELHFHEQCFDVAGHFAGDDRRRSEVFLSVANDAAFDAVWFARGGYGACRLDPDLFAKLNDAAATKTYFGYSDAGVLLGRLYKDKIGRSVHGPMPTDLGRENGTAAIERALSYLVNGSDTGFEPTITSGAPVAAFNITVLAHLVATDWAPDFSNHIILLEDVGEYLYRIDRALFAIVNSSVMRSARGLKLGRISDTPKNDRPFGASEEEIFKRWCAAAGLDYLGTADIGHDSDNKVVPFGLTTLRTSEYT